MDILKIINDRLEKKKISRYQLAKRLGAAGVCHEQTAYRFLRGDSDISTKTLGAILVELGLKIV